jgi:hypothetical protein
VGIDVPKDNFSILFVQHAKRFGVTILYLADDLLVVKLATRHFPNLLNALVERLLQFWFGAAKQHTLNLGARN